MSVSTYHLLVPNLLLTAQLCATEAGPWRHVPLTSWHDVKAREALQMVGATFPGLVLAFLPASGGGRGFDSEPSPVTAPTSCGEALSKVQWQPTQKDASQ